MRRRPGSQEFGRGGAMESTVEFDGGSIMRTDKMTINTHEYWLEPSQDLAELKNAVVRAARDGGDLVGFAVAGDAEAGENATVVLVTAHSEVTFQSYPCSPALEPSNDEKSLAQEWLDVEDLVA